MTAVRDAGGPLDETISAIDRLRKTLSKSSSPQIFGSEERSHLKAVALAWFNRHRQAMEHLPTGDLQPADQIFQQLLELSERSPSRSKCRELLGTLKQRLITLRAKVVLSPEAGTAPPSFDKLVADPEMAAILERRWRETGICRKYGAHLAATVMMGALLEALLLARTNMLPNPSPLFRAKTAPKDRTNKVLPLKEWTLRHYLDVAHELGWITRSAKDVGEVLRDYRNYIHPEKERRHGIILGPKDTAVFWTVFGSLAEQVLASI
jgi:hypothetical protein